uniref:hypothetical protein n=1 Tax=Aliarcobacter sp. TaxID=2321116 RepID=UPI004048689D
MFSKINLLISLGILFFITGCSNIKTLEITPENNIINKESSLQIRDIQTRTFENTTKEELLNAIVDTLLDDGYFVNMIDTKAGVISAKNSKNNPELNIVSVVKKLKNNSFLVRFSINAIDKSSSTSNIIIQDDLIYRYLFDKLRKSLFLNENFYDVKNNLEIKKEEKIIKSKNSQEINISQRKTKNCFNSSKCNKLPIVYSVQFLCSLDKKKALNEYNILKSKNLDVRIHPFYEYQVVRLGRYKNRLEAEKIMNDYKNSYPDISIVTFKSNK